MRSELLLQLGIQILFATKRRFGRIIRTRFGEIISIIMEYCDSGDLYQKILRYQKKNKMIAEKEIWDIFIQTVRGLN